VDYDDALRWTLTLPDFERTGVFDARTDIEPMRALLAELGDPHLGRATLHIAGSKGKGSTGVMAEAVLRASGSRTGFYISPHLHRYNERIRIDGAPVAPDAFAAAITSVRAAFDAVALRFPDRRLLAFDALTAAGFVAFRDAAVDAQMIEVGLGGRLDSTNVFHARAADAPHVAVITPISLEHTSILGDTIAAIAGEKSDVIVAGAPVIVAPQRESALDVIRATAHSRGSAVIEVAAACQLSRSSASLDGQRFKLKTSRATYEADLPLIGRHQLDNAATAIVACEELLASSGDTPDPAAVRRALADVSWPGRMEVLRRKPLVVADGAHNGDSAKRITAALRDDLRISSATFVLGTLAGKDVAAMAAAIADVADHVYVAGWHSARAADPREVAATLREAGISCTAYSDLPQAFESALGDAGERGAVVAFGSIAFVAALREYLLGIESDMIRLRFS
jgi:dihydrofolate synthase/folylpolyglutamate synthase